MNNHENPLIAVVIPAWIESLPEDARKVAQVRFVLRVAAVLASADASIPSLSVLMGLAKNTLHATYFPEKKPVRWISVNHIKTIESLIGFGLIPRILMNPDVYGE